MSDGPVCITCGDVAVPMRVLGPGEEAGLVRCATAQDEVADVDVTLVGDVAAGDALLVHACVALRRLAAEEAMA
jgi:hydrogenase maturation factor